MAAKLKTALRKAAARTCEALWDEMGRVISTFTPDECRNDIANCGYAFD